jgi:hypothetical protein
MPLLADFVVRLAFGLALAMALTSPARVTSGYFRNHMYVLLGLNVMATLAAFADRERLMVWPVLTAAVVSYVGAVLWLYEKPRPGILALVLVALLDLAACWFNQSSTSYLTRLGTILHAIDPIAGGLLLGVTLAAMFLGHWYLNTPTLELGPLLRLLKLMAVSLALRVAASALGLIGLVMSDQLAAINLPLLALRWLAGLLAMAAVIWMTWQTLRIPNTQSATGILYVGVILTFLGELVSLLLSRGSPFPV